MRVALSVPIVLFLLSFLSGCSSPAEDAPPAEAEAAPSDPWEGTTEQVLLDIDGSSEQFDVLCTFGGGVRMDRADGLVLAGSKSVELTVGAPPTTTGLQLGYVLTDSPEDDERQEGITWFEPVRGASRSFSMPVTPDAYEDPEGEALWHFFMRVNVAEAPQDCYTGYMGGPFVLKAIAVKG